MLDWIPLKQKGLALIQGRRTYKDVSAKHWVLCPPESYSSAPAIFLDGQLERVIRIAETATYADEMRRVKGGVYEHPATAVYQLRKACVLDGCVYKGASRYRLKSSVEQLTELKITEHISNASLACTMMGNRYFGHWMIDDLALTLAARELAEPVTVNGDLSSQQLEYSRLVGIRATLIERAQIDNLFIIDDRALNSFKQGRITYLRSQLWNLGQPQTKAGVMLLRGTSGVPRLLVNEGEVAEYLRGLGFSIIDPLRLSAEEVIRRCLGATIIVGVTGSQLMPGFLSLAEGGAIMLIQPPFYFENCYKDYADCLGIWHSFVVGEQVGEAAFRIDIDDIARTLDLIAATQAVGAANRRGGLV